MKVSKVKYQHVSLGDRVGEHKGKRKRTANRWYALKSFIRHNDDEGSDVDV